MRKITIGILAAVLVLALGTATAFAAGHYHRNPGAENYGQQIQAADPAQAQQAQNPSASGTEQIVQTVQTEAPAARQSAPSGYQRYCRDADGDGVCDYYGSHRCEGGYGQWSGQGAHSGGNHGHGNHSCWRR